jgi:hypothetical protein
MEDRRPTNAEGIEALNQKTLDIDDLSIECLEQVSGRCDTSRCRDFAGCEDYCGICEGVFSSDLGTGTA